MLIFSLVSDNNRFFFVVVFLIIEFFFEGVGLNFITLLSLTYRRLGRVIPLHALQTTNIVFSWFIGTLAQFFRS